MSRIKPDEPIRAVHAFSSQPLSGGSRRDSFRIAMRDQLIDLTDPDALLDSSASLLAEHLQAERVTFFRCGGTELVSQRTYPSPKEDEAAERIPSGLRGQLEAGLALALQGAPPGNASRLFVPLLRNGALEGSLALDGLPGREWSDEEVSVAQETLTRTWNAVERAHQLENLRQSEDHYRHMVELNPEVPWTADPDGKIVFAPELWRQWTGNSGLGESWTEAVHPEDLPRVLERWGHSVKSGKNVNVEFRILRRGEYVWVSARAFPRKNAAGKTVKWYGLLRDIHSRKTMEEALRRSEEFHRFAVEAGRIGTWDIDLEKQVVVNSPGMAEMLGMPAQWTVLSRDDWERMLGAGELETAIAILRAAARAGGKLQMERRVRLPDGQFRWLFARGEIDFDARGKPARIHGASIDITERKQAEETLREAKTAAEDANRIKDDFLATVSHELRTPLAAILLWSRQMRSESMRPEEMDRAIGAIQQSAEIQSRLIGDLLDLSRMVAGKLRLMPEPTDLVALTELAVELARPSIQEKNLKMRVELEPRLSAWVDPGRMQQVLSNILGNAVKFTPEGGRISVRLRRVDRQVTIEVADTGQGIASEFMPYLFERFQQAEKQRAQQPGLGIGLALCRSVVELHGGTIRAHSPGADQGSVFTITLPLHAVAPETAEIEARSTPTRSSLTGMRLLVVEDDPNTREAMVYMLERAGASVAPFANGKAVLQYLEKLPAEDSPDAMLCDIGLPGMDGCELIQRIHDLNHARGRQPIPACAVSAYARDVDRQRALAAGFDLHLPKPMEPEALLDAVEELVSIARHEEGPTE